jgi:hypothetical protein
MQLHYATCALLILFFAWMLLHAAMHTKSATLIEGLAPSKAAPSKGDSSQAQAAPSPAQAADPNPSEIAFMKEQISTLMKTAQQLKTQMIKNESGIKNNTTNIEKVVQSQNETNAQLTSMKSAK